MTNADLVVDIERLSKRYGKTLALDEVTLQIQRGEVFGYLGPNGAGKTTTLRVLLGLLRPTSGRARVFGCDTWTQSTSVRARTGYVPGEIALYERMTGRQLLEYLGALRGGVDAAYVTELADRLDIDLGRPLRTLSKGNRQKVAVVQAFMGRPELIVLDEPTSGLDPLVQRDVHRMIRDHVDGGGTVLLSSHVLSEVQQVADRVGIIRRGRLLAVERLEDLRAKSLHHVTVRFASLVDASAFRMPGVRDVTVDGTHLTCAATQEALDRLVKQLSRYRVTDLACEEASLEDTFLAYYAEDGRHAA